MTSVKLSGASGLVKIIAPLPPVEIPDKPYRFLAWILAKMLDPHGRLNGADVKVEIGTRQ